MSDTESEFGTIQNQFGEWVIGCEDCKIALDREVVDEGLAMSKERLTCPDCGDSQVWDVEAKS